MRTQPCLTLVLSAVVLFSVPGCPKPQDTLQTLQKEVSAYAAAPTDEAAAKIDASFNRLDGQIAKICADGKIAEAGNLGQQRDALQAQYAAARMTASLLKAREAAAKVGEAFRTASEAFGQALHDGSTNSD